MLLLNITVVYFQSYFLAIPYVCQLCRPCCVSVTSQVWTSVQKAIFIFKKQVVLLLTLYHLNVKKTSLLCGDTRLLCDGRMFSSL